jgi:hypothetical protein
MRSLLLKLLLSESGSDNVWNSDRLITTSDFCTNVLYLCKTTTGKYQTSVKSA